MKKIKTVNGYLIVQFSERDRREYTTLSEYGIIDPELYNGSIGIDRGAMEYDDIGTIEEAIEKARSLGADTGNEKPETPSVATADLARTLVERGVELCAEWDKLDTALRGAVQLWDKDYNDRRRLEAGIRLDEVCKLASSMGVAPYDDFREQIQRSYKGRP